MISKSYAPKKGKEGKFFTSNNQAGYIIGLIQTTGIPLLCNG